MMLKQIIAVTAMFASSVSAQDFSENSEAKSWKLYAEVPARFEAKVVDLVCELTGDCPADCGAGKRQMGLLRTADNQMVFPMKNSQSVFAGAAVEFQPFCNQIVEVDGLMIDDPEIGANNVYLVQRIKADGADWIKANQWSKQWAKENPEAEGKGPWFRRDLRVKEIIATEGHLGLGLDVDKKYIEENF